MQTIGLGKEGVISELLVHCPNSPSQTFTNLSPNQKYVITEGEAIQKNVDYTTTPFNKENGNHHHHHH